ILGAGHGSVRGDLVEGTCGVPALGGSLDTSEIQPLTNLADLGGGVLEQLPDFKQGAGLDGGDGPVEIDNLSAAVGGGLDLIPHLQGGIPCDVLPDELLHALNLHISFEAVDLCGETALGGGGIEDFPREA